LLGNFIFPTVAGFGTPMRLEDRNEGVVQSAIPQEATESILDSWLKTGGGSVGFRSVRSGLESGYRDNRVNGSLFLIFAALALLLASVGLYAVVAHSVSRRTQEIGIRPALGATAGHTLKLVFGQGMLPLGCGLLIGLSASFAVNRLLQSQLVQVSPADPITLAGTSAVLILASMLGCVIPARRAIRVDPVVALRHD
jgi:ABC-type antimicrobial peptide transport system permease subunit